MILWRRIVAVANFITRGELWETRAFSLSLPLNLMSVLDRYLNTEKYQGVMRELAIAQILNEKTKPGLFIKQNALDRCGFTGDADDFPNAEADYELSLIHI